MKNGLCRWKASAAYQILPGEFVSLACYLWKVQSSIPPVHSTETMAEIEEVSSDLLSIVLPTVLGVAMVLVTVAVVFWMGSGPQRSYEEAKAQASLKAEETLKGKEQASPKAKKPRKNFRKKKADEHQEEPEPVAPRKGILKGQSAGVEASAERTPAERTPPNKVEFKLDTTPKETKAPRVDPPTPYPTKDTAQTELAKAPPPPPPPQPIFEEPEPEPVEQPLSRKSVPKKKPPVQAAIGKHEPAERVAIPKEPEIKKRTKNKPKPSGTGGKCCFEDSAVYSYY